MNGRAPQPIKIDGQYALVPLRLYENSVLMGDVASRAGQARPRAAVPVEAAAPAAKPAARTATRTTTSKPVANSRTAAPTPAAKN